ncbi:MAG TPA: hypothetical protein P5525_07520 [Candidatus Paceibacterota bacterium]|nr:hypothetical protein [Candidatus Paceibacterota bacterium]
MVESNLRLTDTNSATDSDGRVWGIEAPLFSLVLCAAFLSIALWLALWNRTGMSATSTIAVGAIPVIVTLAYVLFKQSRPPGYDVDLVEYWLSGQAFGPRDQQPNSDDSDGPSILPTLARMSEPSASVAKVQPPKPAGS